MLQEQTGGVWRNASTAAAAVRKTVLDLVQETGTWLVPLTRGLIWVIPKGEGSVPRKTEAGRLRGFGVQAVGFVEGS